MGQTVLKIVKGIMTTLMFAVMIIAVLLVGVRIFGLQVFTVLSGSMEPEYKTGSIIYVKEVEEISELEVDDVITFRVSGDTIVTHRIIELVPDVNDPTVVRFRTMGDANKVVDGTLVDFSNVIGTPVFTLPYLGYLAVAIQNPPGLYIAITAGIALILVVIILDVATSDTPEKEKEGPKDKDEGEPVDETPEIEEKGVMS